MFLRRCGASFEVSLVVSEKFAGKPPLARHRLVFNPLTSFFLRNSLLTTPYFLIYVLRTVCVQVNAALKEELKEIHALAIKKTLTPEQHAASAEVN